MLTKRLFSIAVWSDTELGVVFARWLLKRNYWRRHGLARTARRTEVRRTGVPRRCPGVGSSWGHGMRMSGHVRSDRQSSQPFDIGELLLSRVWLSGVSDLAGGQGRDLADRDDQGPSQQSG
jgi:hypothetical protein